MNLRVPMTLVVFALLAFAFHSCGKSGGGLENTAIVALSADVENFNPILTTSTVSSEVQYCLYPQMFDLTFDLARGRLIYKPGLVKRWEMLDSGRAIKLVLRRDVRWENGLIVSPQDVKFTYELLGDPSVASPQKHYVDDMIFTNGKFDLDKSIEILDDSTMLFHFRRGHPNQLFYLTIPPLPKYVFKDIEPRSIRQHPANLKPLSGGPYRFERWTRHQEIVFASNPKCTYPGPAILDGVIFRIITEPQTRLMELKKGTIDLMWPVQPEDVDDLKESYREIRLETLPPRQYEYIAWANIDFQEYRKSGGKTIRPHRLFGETRVRQALTYAIDRKSILDAKLGKYGELAVGDISPMFRWAINTNLRPYPYSPEQARSLLRQAGWQDTDGDGVLDRNGVKFEFSLLYNVGNARRAYAATVIQENLKQVGIVVHLVPLEATVLYEKMNTKDYDAVLAGYNVSLSIDPADRWGSIDNPFNSAGFQNDRVKELINLGMNAIDEEKAAYYWKELQAILHQEQPFTFMYWIKDIVGVNRRLKQTNISTLGVLEGIGKWKIGDPRSSYSMD
ncbi:MAG: ABC transporter substrate-binding protein [Bacteroidota bacterium]|nr:ABC transporter substrate-binding protein [Bacteroidota bacterium]